MKRAPLGPQTKISVLLEAVSWLRTYKGATMVIKCNSNAMVNDKLKHASAQDILFLYQVGMRPAVVRDGGPQTSTMLKRLGIASESCGGLRVTAPKVMDVVHMVLTGSVQRELVPLLNTDGSAAVGISGRDGGLLRARQQLTTVGGNEVDVGLVGGIVGVSPQPTIDLLDRGRVLVISSVVPLTTDSETVLSVNTDTAVAAIAVALRARTLLMLIDAEGFYSTWPGRSALVPFISTAALEESLSTLEAGVIPKMEACLRVAYGGVGQAHIVGERQAHNMLLEVIADQGVDAVIHPGDAPVPPLNESKSL